jgi:CBS domain-containing protein
MLRHEIGRLPVTERSAPLRVVGMLTRGDLLRAQR